MNGYVVPAAKARAEIEVINSRLIASAAPAFSVDEATLAPLEGQAPIGSDLDTHAGGLRREASGR